MIFAILLLVAQQLPIYQPPVFYPPPRPPVCTRIGNTTVCY